MNTRKLLLTSLLAAAAMSVSAFGATGDTILINFRGSAGEGSGITGVTGTWNEFGNASGSASNLNLAADGTATASSITWTASGGWKYAPDRVNIDNTLKGYLDDNSTTQPVINIDTTFLVCDVTIYCATDSEGASFAAKNVNGTNYTSSNGATIVGDASWGSSQTATAVEGTNALTVSNLSGRLTIKGGAYENENGIVRGTIAGLKIVDTYAGTAHSATLGGDSAWSGVSFDTAWANSQSTVDASTGQITSTNGAYADFTLTADTTLTFDSAVVTDAICVSGEGKTLTLSNAGFGSLTLSGPAILRADAGATLAFDTSIFNLADNVSDIKLAGAGTINFKDSVNSEAYGKFSNLASFAGTVKFDGAVNLGENALAVSSGIREFAGGLTAGAVTVSGGTLIFGGASTSFTSANVSSGTLKFDIGAGNEMVQSGAINGANSDASNLVIESGKLTLTRNDNNFRGVVQINNGGILQLNSGAALQTAYSNANYITVNSGGELRMDNFAYEQLGGSPDYAKFRVINGGKISITGSNSQSGQGFTVSANGGEFLMEQSGQTLTLNGNGNSGIIALNGALKIGGAGDIIINKNASQVAIAGTGSLEKVGAGTLTINSAGNTYEGGTIVSEGVLVAGVADALGAGNVRVASGAALERGLASGSVTIGSTLTTEGSAILSTGALNAETAAFAVTGAVTLSAGTIFDVDSIVTNGKLISGTGLSEDGLGIANLSIGGYLANQRGIATFSVSDAGVLTLDSYREGAKYSLTWDGGVSGVWKVNGSGWTTNDTTDEVTFQNGDSVTFGEDTTNTATLEGSLKVNALTISAATSLTGTGTVRVDAANLTTTAALTLGENVVLDLGSISAATNKTISGTGTVKVVSSSTNPDGTPNHNGTLTLGSGFSGTIEYSGKFDTSNGTNNSKAKFALSNGSMWGNQTIANDIHFLTNYQLGDSSATTIVLNGNLTQEAGTTLTIVNADTNITFGGAGTVISDLRISAGTLTMNAGKATIKGGQLLIGNLVINSGAMVNVGQNDSLNYGASNTVTVNQGGVLSFGNKRWTVGQNNKIVINGGEISGAGEDGLGALDFYQANTAAVRARAGSTSTISAAIRLRNANHTQVFMTEANAVLTLSGLINGEGTLVKAGTGELVVSGTNTYTGGTTIEGGVLKVDSLGYGNKGNLGTKFTQDGTVIKNGGVLEVTAAQNANSGDKYRDGGALRGFSVTSDEGTYRYSGTGTSLISHNAAGDAQNQHIGIAGGATLIFDVTQDAATLEVSKIIASNAVQASMSEALAETTGALKKIGAGTLTLSGANLYSGGTTIEQGVLVAGSASALGSGKTTVAADAKLGLVAGTTVTVTNGIDLASGAKIVVDLSSKASATETFTLDLVSGTALRYNEVAFEEDCTSLITGGIVVLKNMNLDGWTQSLSYADNKLSLTLTIPEPSVFGLLAGLGALALAGTRRRRKKA